MEQVQNNVPNIILSQLGGRRFVMMTGSTNLFAYKNRLGMKLRRNKSGANHLTIELTVMDDYTMTFKSVRGTKITTKKEIKGVYCDQLESIFTQETGLYTRL